MGIFIAKKRQRQLKAKAQKELPQTEEIRKRGRPPKKVEDGPDRKTKV